MKYEYSHVIIFEDEDVDKELNKFGKEGWVLVNCIYVKSGDCYEAFFMRELN